MIVFVIRVVFVISTITIHEHEPRLYELPHASKNFRASSTTASVTGT
jgi:hypothetical protein